MRDRIGVVIVRALACLSAVVVTVGLTGCADGTTSATGPRPSPSSTRPSGQVASAPALESVTTPTPTAEDSNATIIDVSELPEGEAPRAVVLVGTTLFHDGKQVRLDLSDLDHEPERYVHVVGSLDGSAYVTVSEQLYRVGDDGSLTAVGVPHASYGSWPRMSEVTGHVFFFYYGRTESDSSTTVVDARTGEVLAVARTARDFRRLERADRRFLDGPEDPLDTWIRAASPNGRTGFEIRDEKPSDRGSTTGTSLLVREVLVQWRLSGTPSVARRLLFSGIDGVAFEDDDTYLVLAPGGRAADGTVRRWIVRCDLIGACERAAETSGHRVSMVGNDPVA